MHLCTVGIDLLPTRRLNLIYRCVSSTRLQKPVKIDERESWNFTSHARLTRREKVTTAWYEYQWPSRPHINHGKEDVKISKEIANEKASSAIDHSVKRNCSWIMLQKQHKITKTQITASNRSQTFTKIVAKELHATYVINSMFLVCTHVVCSYKKGTWAEELKTLVK